MHTTEPSNPLGSPIARMALFPCFTYESGDARDASVARPGLLTKRYSLDDIIKLTTSGEFSTEAATELFGLE